jgi:putative oxidoreductase
MPLLFVIGRILLGVFFLDNAYKHFKNTDALAGYASSKEVPAPKFMVRLTGALLAIGGLSLIFGSFTNIGIYSLVLFLIPVSFQMHAFWKETDPTHRATQRVQFMKNIALLGALLMLLSLPTPWMNSF